MEENLPFVDLLLWEVAVKVLKQALFLDFFTLKKSSKGLKFDLTDHADRLCITIIISKKKNMTLMYVFMENYLKVLKKSWKSPEKLEAKICTSPV